MCAFRFFASMMLSNINSIVVCGAGTMGSGIAQVAAQSGFRTTVYDLQEAYLDKSKTGIVKSLDYLVSKQKIGPEEKAAVLDRILFTTEIKKCSADLVIEAIVEIPKVKLDLFHQLDLVNPSTTLFASNTSSLSITDLQKDILNPERFAGMHFFNPANIMKLVEIVQGSQTDTQTTDTLAALAVKMGKVPVHCKDAPGFIVNHVARTYYLEAMHLLTTGVADIETIDTIMEATGFKMGPFRLMDMIGMDINYKVSEIVWDALGRPDRLQPATIQKQKVEAGELGRKTGKGFYDYA